MNPDLGLLGIFALFVLVGFWLKEDVRKKVRVYVLILIVLGLLFKFVISVL